MAAASSEFNYRAMKKEYRKQAFRKKIEDTKTLFFNRDSREKAMSLIIAGKKRSANGIKISRAQDIILRRFDVSEVNGVNELILKPKWSFEPTRVVVTIEDSFDIILNAHLSTNHGRHRKLHEMLRNDYFINGYLIKLVIDLCNLCRNIKEKRTDVSVSPNIKSNWVFVLDMQFLIDNAIANMKYILIVVDNFTQFIHLRPLFSNEENDVAIELLKIFMDFGPPQTLETSEYAFYMRVCKILSSLCNDCFVSVKNIDSSLANGYRYIAIVNALMKDWVTNKRSIDWSMACHMVQWQINNTYCTETKNTPYNKMFGKDPNKALGTRPIWNIAPNKRIYSGYKDMGLELARLKKRAKSANKIGNLKNTGKRTDSPETTKTNKSKVISFESIHGLHLKKPTNEITQNVTNSNKNEDDKVSNSNNKEDSNDTNSNKKDHGKVISFESLFGLQSEDHTNGQDPNTSKVTALNTFGLDIPDVPKESNKNTIVNNLETPLVINLDSSDDDNPEEKDNNLICHYCKCEMQNRNYTCELCRKSVHLFCSERKLVGSIVILYCLSCYEKKKRKEELLKRAAELKEKIKVMASETSS